MSDPPFAGAVSLSAISRGCLAIANNGILRRTSPIFRPVTFLVAFRVVLVAFGAVLVAPRTGQCVSVAYESRARWRRPRQDNHNDVLVSRSRRAYDVTRERRCEDLVSYAPARRGLLLR